MKAITKQIIEQAQAGNQDAFSALYQATYGRNYYVALKMVKREADTEDILQDAYVKIFHNLKKFTYKGENSFASWTTKIVNNTALDFLRRKSPVLFSEMGDDDGEAVFDIEDTSVETRPDLSLDQKETSRIVQELLDELSDEQRICTIMYYVEQLSIAEIAEQCGCSEGTIKSRLRYAKIKLQGQGERLEREGISLKKIAPMAILLLLLQQEMAQAEEKAAPALKLGEILAENMTGYLQGNQIENIVDNARQATVSTIQRSSNKTLMVLLVAGGILIGVAGSYAVQSFNKWNGRKNNGSVIISTASPDVTATPTGMLEAESRTLPTEIPEKLPTETPAELSEETPEEENVETPTTMPAKETDGATERLSPKATKKPTAKPSAKVTKKPTPKPVAKATKKPTTKPKAKATEKPKKIASPKPTKKSSDNPDWDDDYVDWDE